jgi:hypothetical protein
MLVPVKIFVIAYNLYYNPWDLEKVMYYLKMFAEIVHWGIFLILVSLTDF